MKRRKRGNERSRADMEEALSSPLSHLVLSWVHASLSSAFSVGGPPFPRGRSATGTGLNRPRKHGGKLRLRSSGLPRSVAVNYVNVGVNERRLSRGPTLIGKHYKD
ncbi:hypothetical protein BHE74_00052040 [Ensete ventricosum]|nr:hypothetical protein BHE74_00052040 [Ensete ventricosum]